VGPVQRVAVIGCGGAGKSTLARALGERTGLPVVHLDALYWRPGWDPTPSDEWREVVAGIAAGDRWITDGNYGGSLDVRLPAADTVLFLDMPRRVTIPGILRRWWRHHGTAVQAPGCPERVSWEFLRWVWHYRRDSRPRALAAVAAHARSAEVVVLRSRAEVAAFLSRQGQAGQPVGVGQGVDGDDAAAGDGEGHDRDRRPVHGHDDAGGPVHQHRAQDPVGGGEHGGLPGHGIGPAQDDRPG
jgi:adenylate kinase family enzyme